MEYAKKSFKATYISNQYGTKKRLTLPVRKCEESGYRISNSKSTIISQ